MQARAPQAKLRTGPDRTRVKGQTALFLRILVWKEIGFAAWQTGLPELSSLAAAPTWNSLQYKILSTR